MELFNGINGNGQVVAPSVTAEQKEQMQGNPAYKFLRWEAVKGKVPAPAEVEDVETITNKQTDDGDNSDSRSSRKAKRAKD